MSEFVDVQKRFEGTAALEYHASNLSQACRKLNTGDGTAAMECRVTNVSQAVR